jgi:hypothetical protein
LPGLSHLSEATLRKLGLKYVIVCSRLLKGEQSIGGIPLPSLNLLMVVARPHATHAQGLQALVLHELYHFIKNRFQAVDDADWQRQFGAGYANSIVGRTKVSRIREGKPGFVNRYAETFPVEDRAELFAALVLEPTTLVAHIEATQDVRLKEKARYLIDKCARLTDLRLAVPGISY